MRIWHRTLGQQFEPPPAEILEMLVDAGIEHLPREAKTSGDPGLVFFDHINRELIEFLVEASQQGIERVLAIAASRSSLVNGGSWRLLQAGASDVLAWDGSTDPASDIRARLQRWAAIDELLHSPRVIQRLVGQSPRFFSVLRRLVEVARFSDSSVLITGESGTGKELAAHLIHDLDARIPKRDFVVLDCTTIVSELAGSEFFGHERGAFTSAVASRDGAFALAKGGTLFLDEIGELPMPLQAQLLRVVQEKTYKRVGGNSWYTTEFRLVCATNRDLDHAVKRGEFRHDLYYRIASFVCQLPPLRERTGDILPLVRYFIRASSPDNQLDLDDSVRQYFLTRDYPGNIRDLRRIVDRVSSRHVGPGPITAGDIPEEERLPVETVQPVWQDDMFERAIRRALSIGTGLKEIGRASEKTALRIVMAEENGNLQRAAQRLGVSDRALQLRRAAASRTPK